jgi:hypothetical protein
MNFAFPSYDLKGENLEENTSMFETVTLENCN